MHPGSCSDQCGERILEFLHQPALAAAGRDQRVEDGVDGGKQSGQPLADREMRTDARPARVYGGHDAELEAQRTAAEAMLSEDVLGDVGDGDVEFETGAVHMLDDEDSRFLNRFTGNGKIRGFEPNGLGPRDLAAPNEDALGGNYFWALRTELQFPLGLPEEYGITGGLFRLDSRVCADS